MARTLDVEMVEEERQATKNPQSAAMSAASPSPMAQQPSTPAPLTMDVSQIAHCVERLKKLTEADVMLDFKPASTSLTRSGGVVNAPSGQMSDEEMDVDSDDFRSHGYLRYVATGVSKWKDQQHNLSDPPVMVRNMPWRILLMPRVQNSADGTMQRTLGFFLQCNGENESSTWSISASAELTVVNQIHPEKSNPRRINHVFYNKENDWGYSNFLSWKELVDPTKGWVKDDTIIAECKVNAEAPHGVDWDSKRLTGFVGLKNQGATCYMNSLLQSLYFLNKLRKAVYQMPTEGEDSSKNVPLALQRVFYELQTSQKSVGTKKLTRSFGWDNLDSFMQHDVQELTRVLLDNIETKMKGSHVQGVIPELFEGKMLSYIKCKNVDYISSRGESFYDIQLSVKGKKSVYESFKEYVAIETMDGDNKYDAGGHGLQDAEKGVIFTHFPPVLHLHLMRFSFDYNTEQNIKINDRYEFPQRLNLDPFLKEPEATPAVYVLHAVLVHTGDNHGGHYVVYINHAGNNRWCKFDDEVVSRCLPKEAVQSNYGGTDEDNTVRNCTNAYMLVYLRESLLEDVLCPVDDEDIPLELKDRLEEERNQEAFRRREREEAANYVNVSVVREEALFSHSQCDLISPIPANELGSRFTEFKIRKEAKYEDVMKILSESFGYPENQMRIWPICGRDNQTSRPAELEWDNSKVLIEVTEQDPNWKVFLELKPIVMSELNKPLPPFNKNDQICLFFKYFDPAEQKVAYVGHMYVHHKKMKVRDLFPDLCKMAGIPPTNDILIFEEVRHFTLEKAKDINLKISEAFEDLMTGDILVFQKSPASVLEEPTSPGATGEEEEVLWTAKEFFRNMGSNMDITFTDKNSPPTPTGVISPTSITLTCNQKWNIHKVCQVLGKYLQVDPEHIQLHKIVRRDNFTEQTSPIMSGYEGTLKDLFFGHPPQVRNRNLYHPHQTARKLLYEVLEMKVHEFEARKKFILSLYDYENREEREVSLFPLKSGKVADLLVEAAAHLKPGEDPARLRLIDIHTNKCHSIYDPEVPLEQLHLPPGRSLRLDYFPLDQMKTAEDEMLVGVAHYSKEIYNLFGNPFYLLVKANETFANIKERISKYLDLSEKDLEKIKFTLVNTTSPNAVQPFDGGDSIKLARQKEPSVGNRLPRHANSSTYIGLDHSTKSVKPALASRTRFQHHEKSIQILN